MPERQRQRSGSRGRGRAPLVTPPSSRRVRVKVKPSDEQVYASTHSAFCASCSSLFERLKPDQTRCESCLRKANVERAVVLARTMKLSLIHI